MSRFAYSAVLGSGERVGGVVRSRDRRDAIRQLIEKGYHPLSLELAQGAGNQRVANLYHRWLRRVSAAELAVFTRQWASLLKAGMPMLQSLATLRRQIEHRGLSRTIEDMEAGMMRDVGTVADALDDHPHVFSPVYRGLVRSGEQGGQLVEVLQRLASYLGRSARLRGQVIGAFIYPIFLLVLGTVAIFVLMTFVIPKFQDLFESFGRELPLPTRVLIATSNFLADWWWAVGGAFLGMCLIVVLVLRKPYARKALDRATLGIPVLGKMVLKLEIARISHTLAALLNGGVGILEALTVTRDTARNLIVRATFARIIDDVTGGESLATAVGKTGVYPPMMVNLIHTGEQSGELPEMLQELATIYEDEADRSVQGAVKLLEPMLIMVMGLIIAGIVAAVILPIFRSQAIVS